MSLDNLYALSVTLLRTAWRMILSHAQQNPWAVVVLLYGMARAFGVMIQSGQRGVLFRWGWVVKELEPGFHWLIPFVHGVKITPVRSISIDLPNQKMMTADGLVYDVGVNVVYRVENATKAMTLVDHVDSGCRAAIPLIVSEVLRIRDQAQLVDRVSLDRELTERMNAWIARWGLTVEQAGFTTIAPHKSVLHTTQLRAKTTERALGLRALIAGGLDGESALVMLGSERQPVSKSSRRYHRSKRQPRRTAGPRSCKPLPPPQPVPAKPDETAMPPNPTVVRSREKRRRRR